MNSPAFESRVAGGEALRVLLLHQVFNTPTEPGHTRHYELAQHLRRFGIRLTALTSDVNHQTGEPVSHHRGLVAKERVDGIDLWRCYTYHALHRGLVHRAFAYLSFTLTSFLAGMSASGIDAIWTSCPPLFQGLSGLLLARLKRKPLIFEVRDLWPDSVIDLGYLKRPISIFIWRLIERLLYHSADTIIVSSPGFLPHLRTFGVPCEKITIVSNGVETRQFDPENDGHAFRQRHGLVGKFVVMYAGTHGLAMDFDAVLDAAAVLRGHDDIRFVLVGDGMVKPRLMERAARDSLDNVVFVDYQPKTEMPGVLAAADVCLATLKNVPALTLVYPSKVFDYMAAGRPTLLAVEGVIRQVVEEADAGIFVPAGDVQAMADAVLRLYRDPELRIRQGHNAREYVESHFDRSRQAAVLAGVIKNVVRRTEDGLVEGTVCPRAEIEGKPL